MMYSDECHIPVPILARSGRHVINKQLMLCSRDEIKKILEQFEKEIIAIEQQTTIRSKQVMLLKEIVQPVFLYTEEQAKYLLPIIFAQRQLVRDNIICAKWRKEYNGCTGHA